MANPSLYFYLACIVVYRACESIAAIRAGVWSRKPIREWTLYPIIGSYFLVLGCPLLEYWRLGTRPGAASYLLGGALFLFAAFFRARGLLDLGKGFSMAVEIRAGQTLVETGLYRRIRHPLYLGTCCLFLACPVFLAARWSFLPAAAGFLSVYARIRKEEAFLAERLPGYREYMDRTWRMVPGVW